MGLLRQWRPLLNAKRRGTRPLEFCLQNGGVDPRQIGYVNAHATSTRAGDGREAEAIARVFGDYRVPVTSTKGQTGHEMWMAGASELIYSVLMMKNGFIADNLNFENADEHTACVNVIPRDYREPFRHVPLQFVRIWRHQLVHHRQELVISIIEYIKC